jgi:hypothetical protein
VRDPYKFLNVPYDVTEEALRSRYRELAKKLHGDAGGSDEMMKLLNEAREQIQFNIDNHIAFTPGADRDSDPSPEETWRFQFLADHNPRLALHIARAEKQAAIAEEKESIEEINYCLLELRGFLEELAEAVATAVRLRQREDKESLFQFLQRIEAAIDIPRGVKNAIHEIRQKANQTVHFEREHTLRTVRALFDDAYTISKWFVRGDFTTMSSRAESANSQSTRDSGSGTWGPSSDARTYDTGGTYSTTGATYSRSPYNPSPWRWIAGAGAGFVLLLLFALSGSRSPTPSSSAQVTKIDLDSYTHGPNAAPRPPIASQETVQPPPVHVDPAPASAPPPPPQQLPAPVIQVRDVGAIYALIPGTRYGLDMVQGVTSYSILNGAVILSRPNGQIDRGCSNWGFNANVLAGSIPPTNYIAACNGRPASLQVISINGMSMQGNAPNQGQQNRYYSTPGVGAPGAPNPRYHSVPGLGG